MSLLHLSMRHFKLHEHPEPFGASLGEGLYTLTTSNYRWPRGISYEKMMKVRREVIASIFRREN